MGTGKDVQGGGSDGVSVWGRELDGDGNYVDGYRRFSLLGCQKNLRERQLEVLGTTGGNGHQWKKPWKQQGFDPPRNKFRGERPLLLCTFPTVPDINYAREQTRLRDPDN